MNLSVIEPATDWDRVAVTLALVSVVGARVRQISDDPLCVLVRFTRTQVSPPPATPVTVVFAPMR